MKQADQLATRMVAALRQRDSATVLALAEETLAGCSDRPQLRARVLAWIAQAHRFEGDGSASAAFEVAIEAALSAGDTEGAKDLRALIEQPLPTAQSTPAIPLPDTPLGRACAALDAGETAKGADLARQAIAEAKARGDARDIVLSLLALARVPGEAEQAIRSAHVIADTKGEKNLVTAVAHAARSASIRLPPKVF